ncbi:TPR-like protein [Rhizophagus irregularis]|uniref:TPR-like protein n=1 Tax=Rhizophagus irregularis TaxID=588596 RepID=A0A2N0PCM5_9GLOM|nr:TPR-like protein [Rhizophagus irregularis]
MEGSSSQSGSSSSNTIPEIHGSAVFSYKTVSHENFFNNSILLKLEENGFTTPDEKAEELIKRLAYIKYLYALKLLFENLQNEFSPQILRDTLVALADPTPFDFYAKQSVTRLELHLRTWVTVLERICFSPIVLSKELRDKVYNSLSKFAEIHRKTTQVIEIGVDNNFKSNFNQFNQQNNNQDDQIITKKRNYNIDFLLIHLRDTLHSLRDDETWFQEIIRRTKNLLKTALNITPGILTTITGINLPSDCSILSILNQVRESLSFKYPVASYYVDWRIMLIIQRNLFTWSEAHFYLKEAVSLKPKEPIAYLICGEIFFWQSNYKGAKSNLRKSRNYKAKINNLDIILGNSCLLDKDYYDAKFYYNIALENSPYNYLCLKNNACSHAKFGFYNRALEMLDKLLNINKDDSLILCYYGEILCNMGQYSKAISYFTKANIKDPENTHNLNKRAIAYYTLQDYNKVLLDLDKVIQLDPLNNLAFYLKCLTYYTKKDIDNAIMVFEKCEELLDFNDILSKTLLFHLEYLLNKNNFTELNNILTKISQISNIEDIELLLFVRCKVYVELKMYHETILDLNLLYGYNSIYKYISHIYIYTDFWLYLNITNDNDDLSKLGIVNGFSKHMYEKQQVYFISNLNSGQYKDSELEHYEHVLKYEDVLKLEGLGWIEYQLPISVFESNVQPSIEINDSINMQIDYYRRGYNVEETTYIPNISSMGDLLPNFHNIYPNVPETFKDKYFSRKEMENLLELKDIINHL